MKQFCAILFFVLQLSIACYSQNFEKRYPYIQFVGDIIELDNQDIVFIGRYRADYKQGSILFKITSSGDSIFAKDFPMSELSHFIKTSDRGFGIGGTSMQNSPLFIKMDSLGNIIWNQNYGGYGSINGLVEKPGGGFLLLENGFKLRCTDASGNTLWYKDLGVGKNYALQDVKILKDGNYICGGYDYNLQVPYYAKVTVNGDILWDKIYSSLKAEIWSANPTKDGGFILSGNFFSGPGTIKCDAIGEVEFSKKYATNGIGDFRYGEQTSDSGFVFSGLYIDNGSSLSYMYVVKTDSKGDTLWTRKINYNSISTFISDCNLFKVIELKNKKYLIGGYNGNISYLALLDSTTNFSSNPPPFNNDTSSTDSLGSNPVSGLDFQIYPNPFTDKAIVKFGDAFPQCDFVLYDGLGQPIKEIKSVKLHEFEITRDGLSDGVYFYKCFYNNRIISKGKVLIVR